MHLVVKISFPARYVKGITPFTFVYLDEAKEVLDNYPASPQQLPSGYKLLFLNPSLVDDLTDQNQLSIKPTLSKSKSYESIPDPNQLVEGTIDTISPLVNCTFPEESEYDTT